MTHLTPLDLAFQEASQDPNKRVEYYDILLNAVLYFPVHDMPKEPGRHRAGHDEQIRPILLDVGGKPHLMVFETPERLIKWAKREVGNIGLPGYALVETSAPAWYWALNAGTPFSRVFSPDKIAWIKQRLASSNNTMHVPPGTKISYGPPAKDQVPAGLEEALVTALTRNQEVSAAFLGTMHIERAGETPHLIVVLRTIPSSESALQAIHRDVGMSTLPFNVRGGVDIVFESGSAIGRDLARIVPAFYVRKAES